MANILDEIVAYKKDFVAKTKKKYSVNDLENFQYFNRNTISLKNNITHCSGNSVIAEFKRKSPSKGEFLDPQISSKPFIDLYKKSGAVGVSILTDEKYFNGTMADIMLARDVDIPILRKDFIVDSYQIYESKAIGADAILLIAEILSKEELKYFTDLAHSIHLEVLTEIHSIEELKKIYSKTDFLGVNNRNLKSFDVSISNSKSIFSLLPKATIKISESGITNVKDLSTLKKIGYDAFLIGEAIVRRDNPERFLKHLVVSQ